MVISEARGGSPVLLTATLILLTAGPVQSLSVVNRNDSLEAVRDSKFIFTFVKFPNVQCGSGLNAGTCFTSAECAAKGGEEVGSCAQNYGVCCKITLTGCGGTITQNNTLVLSTDYPSYYNKAQTCEYKVQFDDSVGNICHIRYEHISNELVAPSQYGVCSNDRLVFKEDSKSTYFCGKAPDNYHWNVETSGTTSPHTFTITTDSSNSNRRYAILVTWIPCSERVPAKCGMYFTGTSGRITSYNFGNGYYLAGLKYSVCFRKEKDYCTYSLLKTTDDMFIGGNNDIFRIPAGKEIQVSVNPTFALVATTFCNLAKTSAMYKMLEFCHYPTEIVSDQTQGPFYINIVTEIDTNDNFNNAVSSPTRAGYQFDWRHNKC